MRGLGAVILILAGLISLYDAFQRAIGLNVIGQATPSSSRTAFVLKGTAGAVWVFIGLNQLANL